MTERLDLRAGRDVRIHRSRIVNTERIKELQPWFNGEYVVVLRNGTRLPLSCGYRDKLQEQLGKGSRVTVALMNYSGRSETRRP